MDGIRSSRPFGSGGPSGPGIDDLDGLWPRDDAGLAPPPAMPIDAPSGWFDRADGVDFGPELGDTALWAVGGHPLASPLAPGDGVDFTDLLVGGWDTPGVLPVATSAPLDLDGVDLLPLTLEEDVFAEDRLNTLLYAGNPFAAANALDGVEPVTLWVADGFDAEFAPGLAALAPGLPGAYFESFADDVDFSGDEGIVGGTFFPAMYKADPLDGADPAPGFELPPPATPELDGLSWPELDAAPIGHVDDSIFIPEIEPLVVYEPTF